jgi:hypothetical protein
MSSPHRAAVTIGINYDRFPPDVDRLVQTRAGLNRLQFAEADAEDLAQELESAGYAVVLLTGAAATRRAIIDAITRQRQAVAPDGLLLIHFSGHGDVDADGNAYLLPADADPRHLLATAIPLDDLAQRYLGRLEAAVTLLDCCHSGYAVGMRGGEGAARDERGEARTFLNQARATFQQVRGRIVLAACGGDQLARELADLRHGAFTYYMLEHLRTNPDAVDVELLYRDIDQGLAGRGLPPPVRGGATLGRIILRDPRPERLPGPVSPFVPDPNQDQRVQLRQALLTLSADQLDEILFRLSLTYERLPGSDHSARLRNLIRSLDQAGQLATLAQALDDMRAAAQAAREQAEREAARIEQERLDHERQEREQAERVRAEAAREEARPPATRWAALKRLVPERQERDRQEQRRRAPAHGAAEQHAGPQVAPTGQQDSEPPPSATATTPIGSAQPLTQENPAFGTNPGQAIDATENRMAQPEKTRLAPNLTRLARVIAGPVVLLILMGVTYLYINRDTSRITLRGHTDALLSAAYSPDGKTIVTASKDGTAKIWDAASGRELDTLRGHTDWVTSAAYSPDGKTIVTANRGGTAKIWDAQP